MSASPTRTYYQRLGILPAASSDEIRQAYRFLSKRYHPDTSALPPEVAIRRFQELQEAYRVLSNPQQRAAYDVTLQMYSTYNWPVPPPQPPLSPLEIEMKTRPLSGTELFVIVLMGGTFVLCLMLVLILAWIRSGGLALMG